MPRQGLTAREEELKDAYVRVVEELFRAGEEAVGHIADYVGEYGTDSDDGLVIDTAVTEGLRHIVDNIALFGRV
jgi:hypothetical protein